ncbi:hypothetical protein A8M60_03435 [Nocardia farcinica]|nr:hypothetical protein A8M60_03435 [Nocardia farcinica]
MNATPFLLYETIDRVYAAGSGEELWRDAIQQIFTLVDANGGGIVETTGEGGRKICASTLSSEAVADYAEYYGVRDHVLDAVERGPIGLPRDGSSLIWPNMHTEFCADWVKSNEMGDGIFLRINESATLVCGSARHREPYATRDRLAAVRILAPHVRRAFDIGAHRAAADRDRLTLRAVLDTFDRPTFVITPEMEIEHLNAAANDLLAEADGLTMGGAGHIVPSARTYGVLRKAVLHATTHMGNRVSTTIVIPRPSGRRPLLTTVAPFPQPGLGRRALLTVTSADRRISSRDPEALRDYFGLTVAEARIAILLAEGADLGEIAGRLDVALSTVRTHLQHVFDKTATSRQAELATMVAKVLEAPR